MSLTRPRSARAHRWPRPYRIGPVTRLLAERWPLAGHLWFSSGLAALALLFVGAVAGVTGFVSVFTEIETSAWNLALSIPSWWMVGMGAYLTGVYLPLYITHGFTRRQLLREALAIYVPLFTAAAAGVMALGFLLERVVYSAMGWEQTLEEEGAAVGLFSAPDQYGQIFLAYWLTFPVFLLVGALVAAAFYRRSLGGLGGVLFIPVAFALMASTELVAPRNAPGALSETLDLRASTPVAVAVSLAALVVAAALAWWQIRDLPIRTNVP